MLHRNVCSNCIVLPICRCGLCSNLLSYASQCRKFAICFSNKQTWLIGNISSGGLGFTASQVGIVNGINSLLVPRNNAIPFLNF